MKEFRIFYIVLLVISLAMSFVYQSRLMPVVFIILALCPLLSLTVLIINKLALEIQVSPDELITEKYEDGIIVITLKNRFLFPISPVRLRGYFQGGGERDLSEKIILADVAPFTSVTLNLPFSMPYRGEYTTRLEKAELFDIFKLFKMSKKINKTVNIVVLPREIHLNSLNDLNETESENIRGVFSLLNKDVFSSLREYREGDNPRHIHWKLSAKQDELIVKQMEQSLNNSAVIYCDFNIYPEFAEIDKPSEAGLSRVRNGKEKKIKKKRDKNYYYARTAAEKASRVSETGEIVLKVTDNIIEAALAVARRIVLDNNSVKVCWQNGGKSAIEEHSAENYNTFGELFYKFAILRAGDSGKPFHEMLEFYGGHNDGRMVYIIAPVLNKKLLETLEAAGYAARRDVVLILLDYMKNSQELLNYIEEKTQINLKLINENNIDSVIN